MQPSDSLPPSATAPVLRRHCVGAAQLPLAVAYLSADACSVPKRPTTCAPATCRASETN